MKELIMFILWFVIMVIRTTCLIMIARCIWDDYKNTKKDRELWENREKLFDLLESEVESNDR